jgi:protein-L-isoaspartate(D-aspartate) O-methyltransferase
MNLMIKSNNNKSIKTLLIVPIISVSLISAIFLLISFSTSCSKPANSIATGSDKYEIKRTKMVEEQIIARGITDKQVINTMLNVPRHLFVDESQWDSAYNDYPLPIGMGQTISQPYIVALMTENLKLTGKEKVLEIGTGSGYQAAILAEIVDQVYTVEIIPLLYESAKKPLSKYTNVMTSNHDGYYGWKEFAPFDRIIVTAAPDHIPQPLIEQLKDGGIMVIPVGPPGWNQVLWKVTKENGDVKTQKIIDFVSFVPLTRESS